MSFVAKTQEPTTLSTPTPLTESHLLDSMADYASHWRQARSLWEADETVANFEAHFKSFSRNDQERIYRVAFEVARDFCTNDLVKRDSIIKEAEENLFAFPYAKVGLTDFDRLNKLWAIMEQELGYAAGVRFVIDSERNSFVFGIAKTDFFRSVPVTQFTKIIASRSKAEDSRSALEAFVIPGKEHIFLLQDRSESQWEKFRNDRLAAILWEYASHSAANASQSNATFKEDAKAFAIQQVLLHEYGHLLSFRDKRVKNVLLEPYITPSPEPGRKFVHPSFQEFHALGEIYPELYGVVEELVARRDDVGMALALAYYMRTLTNSSINGRNRADVLLPIFLRNVRVDHEERRLTIDYEGFQDDLQNAKDFLYQLFDRYRNISEEALTKWVQEYTSCLIQRSLKRAFNVKGSRNTAVEPALREYALMMVSVEAMVPYGAALQKLRDLKQKYSWEEDYEEIVARLLPRLIEELRIQAETEALSVHAKRVLNWFNPRFDRQAEGMPAASLPSFLDDMNELLDIEGKLGSAEYCRSALDKGLSKSELPSCMSNGRSITNGEIWDILQDQGYLNEQGILQAKFTGQREDFSIPIDMEGVEYSVFKALNRHKAQKERLEKNLLNAEEVNTLAQKAHTLASKYPHAKAVTHLSSRVDEKVAQVQQQLASENSNG